MKNTRNLPMFRIFNMILALLFGALSLQSFAQSKPADISVYGLNPLLHNGKVYNYFPGANVKGHPYFSQKEYVVSSVKIRNQLFENVLLNYDILNQSIILKYTDAQGSNRLIALSDAWLSEFKIGEDQFYVLKNNNKETITVQTLCDGNAKLHIQWHKRLVADISFISEHYMFEAKRHTIFFESDRSFHEVKSIKDILKNLSPEKQISAKQFARQNKIKLGSTKTEDLVKAVNFLNQSFL